MVNWKQLVVSYRHLSGGTEKTHEISQSKYPLTLLRSNRIPHECGSRAMVPKIIDIALQLWFSTNVHAPRVFIEINVMICIHASNIAYGQLTRN
jgi:hypothetical protein